MAIFALQALVPARSLVIRSIVAVVLAMIGCLLHGAINEVVFLPLSDSSFVFVDYLANSINWFWFYLSLSALFIAINHWAELAENRLQLEKLRTLASTAQLSALRYQLNPHFLFNALNSIASLVEDRQQEEAERMINRLSDFLRAGLDADPLEEVELAEELAQQRRYLEIERIRFPSRLAYAFHVEPAVEAALVPSLILQPLVENAIKYAVAPSPGLVSIAIEARRLESALRIVVSDNGLAQAPGGSGAGIGLANVRERLASLFGDAASMEAGALDNGGYAVTLTMPLKRA
jgi:LytS/YehU family sensor histidine kinase